MPARTRACRDSAALYNTLRDNLVDLCSFHEVAARALVSGPHAFLRMAARIEEAEAPSRSGREGLPEASLFPGCSVQHIGLCEGKCPENARVRFLSVDSSCLQQRSVDGRVGDVGRAGFVNSQRFGKDRAVEEMSGNA
ncbi:hypothetical protein HAP48_0006015 [Bradyrhizobium septentrionale]|uniref:Uncharacterized protein n=1 Tax=Bradyrhizobium septentrionale TaxID=1404411 RepID=A0A973W642_9BRAD|nr:hypothetical protein [Bradyrhizobium septentrionale]UGY17012.1 hypothetical protein HAP48_0006015 [Bradyrhizobium septentrionale]UGY25764.1 hypothetical protein HU675_0002795 [Bradyrhizobium septentrionale]